MKTRIIGTILVILILGALFVVTESENRGTIAPATSMKPNNDNAFKSLNLNN